LREFVSKSYEVTFLSKEPRTLKKKPWGVWDPQGGLEEASVWAAPSKLFGHKSIEPEDDANSKSQ
jgi:hypothetical protein